MKNIRRIFLIFLSVTVILGASWGGEDFAFAANAPEAEGPDIEAEAAIVYCGDSGEVIWQKNADKKMEPASMTKLMTCLLAAENLDMDKVVEISAEAAETEAVKMYLQPGEKITVEELMYGALLTSANDAAVALAGASAGSTEKFVKMMNERAAALGCKNTKFVNPNGLSAEGQYSTCRDMAIIAEEAMGNDTVRKISGTTEHTIEATNVYKARELKNFNMFLSGGKYEIDGETISAEKYDGVFGGKTGSLSKEYCTMVTCLETKDVELYCVIMGTDMTHRFSDMKAVMDYGSSKVSVYKAFKKGDEFGKVKLTGGAVNKVTAIAAEDGTVSLPEGVSSSLVTTKSVYTEELSAPIEKGQRVGVEEIYIDDELYGKVDLLAANEVKEGWFLSRWRITNLQTVIMFTIAGVLLLFLIFIMCMRASNKKKAKRRRQALLEEKARRQIEREQDLKNRNWPYV